MSAEQTVITRTQLFASGEPIELLHATYFTHRFSPHAHDDFAIGVVEAGGVRTRVGRDTETVSAGSVIAFNPGLVHTGEPIDRHGYRYRMMYVSETTLRRLASRESAGDLASETTFSFARPIIDDPALAVRLSRAHRLVQSEEDCFTAENTLVDALGDLVAHYALEQNGERVMYPNSAAVRVVREYLEDEHARVVTLAELSRLTGLSSFYLSRTFRSAVGVPPYAYLALVRVRRARELIAQGYSLSAVTHGTGFSDQSHFTKQFKRVLGVTPGQYAREVARSSGRGATPVRLVDRQLDGARQIPRSWALPNRAAG